MIRNSLAPTKPKAILLFIAITSIIVVSVIFTFQYKKQNTVEVKISFLPLDSSLQLDNKAIKNNSTLHLKPGTYEVVADSAGFKQYNRSLIVREGAKTIQVSDILEATDAVSEKKLNDEIDSNPDMLMLVEEDSENYAETFNDINPIVEKLPIKALFYSIGFRNDPNDKTGQSIILEIDALPDYRQSAINKIRELGYDPGNFKIIFREYESPFNL